MPGGQFINHFGSVMLRVVGSGNLKATLYSLQDAENEILADTVLAASNSDYPILLADFMQRKASLVLETNEIDEVFTIKQIFIYSKPVFTSNPQ